MKELKKISFSVILLIILMSLPTIWALLVPGFFGASDDLHIGWLYEMDKTIRLGQLPPRFVPDLSYGFGYPLFNFVYPLPFYIAEIFHISGVNLVDSIKTLFFISMPLSAIAMYLFLKHFSDRLLSFTGAVVYLYAPYRANDLYNRGAIGEIVSFVFLPLILLAVVKVLNNNQHISVTLSWIGIGGLSIAGLILSHNITAYMFFPFVVSLIIYKWSYSGKNVGALFSGGLTFLLASLISLYFWLAALVDSRLMKYDTVFNFVDHFPTIKQLFTPYWGYGASVPGPYDGMSFFLGYGTIALMVIGSVGFIKNINTFTEEKKRLLKWSITSLIVVSFLMNYRSSFIWSNIPLLSYFQFPWRFLILTTFFAPIFVIGLESFKYKKIICIFIVALSIGVGWDYFKPHDFLGRTDAYFLNRYIPDPIASDDYKQVQEEYLRLPKDTQMRPSQMYARVFPQESQVKSVHMVNDLTAIIETDSHFTFELSYNKYYFPGWNGYLDGKPFLIKAGDPFGQIAFTVPSGRHSILITFKETWFKRWLDLISILSFAIAIGLIFNTPLLRMAKYYRKKMSNY